MGFQDELNEAVADCVDQLGISVVIHSAEVGALDTVTGERPTLTGPQTVMAIRSSGDQLRVPVGRGAVDTEGVQYLVQAADLTGRPDEGGSVEETGGDGHVRTIGLVEDAAGGKAYRIWCQDAVQA